MDVESGRVIENDGSSIPCSAPGDSPIHGLPLACALDVLEAIEALPADTTGALVYREGAAERGAVLVEGGRVCWAATTDMRRRLTDILRFQHDPPLDASQLERIYKRCSAEKKPLGEELVASGLVTRDELRSALRQHNAEALMLLGTARYECGFRAHARKRYDAAFTYSTMDLLTSIGAILATERVAGCRSMLRAVCPSTRMAVAFVRGVGTAPLPIGAICADEMTTASSAALGAWAINLIDLSRAISPELRFVATTYTTGTHAILWSVAEVTYVALCEDMTCLARTIQRLRQFCAGMAVDAMRAEMTPQSGTYVRRQLDDSAPEISLTGTVS